MKLILNRQGSLLIEAMLAIVILGVSLTMMIRSLSGSLRAVVYSADYTRAAFLADQKMFDLLRKRFIDANYQDSGSFASNDDFRYQVRVKNLLRDGQPTAINEVALDIFWPAGQKEKNCSITTYLFNTPTQ